jgi:hypothetical protein
MFRESRHSLRNINRKSNKRNIAPEKLINFSTSWSSIIRICGIVDTKKFFLLTKPRYVSRFYGTARWRKYVTSHDNISPLESNVFARLLICSPMSAVLQNTLHCKKVIDFPVSRDVTSPTLPSRE